MANQSEVFKSKEYIELSEILLKNADILRGKLGYLRNDGESLKRTYESLFKIPKDDLDVLIATNSQFADLFSSITTQIEEYNSLVSKLTKKISNVADSYGISNDKAKESLELANELISAENEYNKKREENNQLSEKQNRLLNERDNFINKQLDLQQELIDLANNGLADTDYYDEVAEKLTKCKNIINNIDDKLNDVNNQYSRSSAVLNDTEKTFNKLKSSIKNNDIADNFVKEIKKR